MPATLTTRRFTVDEYYRMAEVGILRPGERVELIEGEIIEMAAIGSRHAGTVTGLNRLFTLGLRERVLVQVQNPVRLDDVSEPEPDLALLRPRADHYTAAHPRPTDVLLVVEVAETTVDLDRGTKARLYAVSGIPEYWLVDLVADEVEVCREPSDAGYRNIRSHRRGDLVSPLAFPDFDVTVADILP